MRRFSDVMDRVSQVTKAPSGWRARATLWEISMRPAADLQLKIALKIPVWHNCNLCVQKDGSPAIDTRNTVSQSNKIAFAGDRDGFAGHLAASPYKKKPDRDPAGRRCRKRE
jgi:hypothetical protein